MRAVEEGYLTFTENGLERMFLRRRGNIDPDLGGETTRASAKNCNFTVGEDESIRLRNSL